MKQEKIKSQVVLQELSDLFKQGLITKEQVLAVLNNNDVPNGSQTTKTTISIQKILYYIGGFILLLGIAVYIQQYWGILGQFPKIALTLGSAVAAYSLGYYFYTEEKSKDFGHAFLIVAAALFPIGIGTSLDVIGIGSTTSWAITINTALLFIIYFASYYTLKANIFLIFSFTAASTLFFSFTNAITFDTYISHFYEYRTVTLGITYLVFGYYFSKTSKKFITNILYFFGLSAILGATLWLQGFNGNKDFLWEILYPFLLIAVFKGSVMLQNKIFILLGTLFTFAEIIKLTSDYFSNTVGWPIALMIAGILMMATGYVSLTVNKRYMQPR